jgi:uncharacterized integral membrane protein
MASEPPQDQGTAAQRRQGRRGSSETARTGGIVVLVIITTVFAVLNVGQVEVNWILGSGRAPLIVVIVISLLVGIVLTHFAERRSRRKR